MVTEAVIKTFPEIPVTTSSVSETVIISNALFSNPVKIAPFQGFSKCFEADISRSDFEKLIKPIVARTGNCCQLALQDAGWNISDIDEVVLVGGSTRVPLVRSYVGEFFNSQPHSELDPDRVGHPQDSIVGCEGLKHR